MGSLEGENCPEPGMGFAAEAASVPRKDVCEATGVSFSLDRPILTEGGDYSLSVYEGFRPTPDFHSDEPGR